MDQTFQVCFRSNTNNKVLIIPHTHQAVGALTTTCTNCHRESGQDANRAGETRADNPAGKGHGLDNLDARKVTENVTRHYIYSSRQRCDEMLRY